MTFSYGRHFIREVKSDVVKYQLIAHFLNQDPQNVMLSYINSFFAITQLWQDKLYPMVSIMHTSYLLCILSHHLHANTGVADQFGTGVGKKVHPQKP